MLESEMCAETVNGIGRKTPLRDYFLIPRRVQESMPLKKVLHKSGGWHIIIHDECCCTVLTPFGKNSAQIFFCISATTLHVLS